MSIPFLIMLPESSFMCGLILDTDSDGVCGCSLMGSSIAHLRQMFLPMPVNWKPKTMMSRTMGQSSQFSLLCWQSCNIFSSQSNLFSNLIERTISQPKPIQLVLPAKMSSLYFQVNLSFNFIERCHNGSSRFLCLVLPSKLS